MKDNGEGVRGRIITVGASQALQAQAEQRKRADHLKYLRDSKKFLAPRQVKI